MLFKDLKQGYPVYILDRMNVDVRTANVVTVGTPHIDTNYRSQQSNNMMSPFNNITEMVVDITVDENGTNRTYTFKDTLESGYCGQMLISTNRDCILRELEAIKTHAEDALKDVDKHKTSIEKCSKLMVEFNPAYKDKKETEERFSKLEIGMDELKTMMKNMLSSVSNRSTNNFNMTDNNIQLQN